MKIHHFGFLTKSISEALLEFKQLGYIENSELVKDELRGIEIQFIESGSGELIELIAPYTENSIVSKLLKKFENKIYHTCYMVENLDIAIKELEAKGFMVIDSPKFAKALNCSVVFLYGSQVGLVELMINNK